MPDFAWTDERVAFLKERWADGATVTQIAAEIGGGVTRNAVIGKVHRIKLSQRSNGGRLEDQVAASATAPDDLNGKAPRTPRKTAHPKPLMLRAAKPRRLTTVTLAPAPKPASQEIVSMRAAKSRPARPVTVAKAPVSELCEAATAALSQDGGGRLAATAGGRGPLVEGPDVVGANSLQSQLIDNVIPMGQRRTLLELNEFTCRWPIGDPGTPDFFFCGTQAVTGLPYCACHSRIAYQPSGDRRRERGELRS